MRHRLRPDQSTSWPNSQKKYLSYLECYNTLNHPLLVAVGSAHPARLSFVPEIAAGLFPHRVIPATHKNLASPHQQEVKITPLQTHVCGALLGYLFIQASGFSADTIHVSSSPNMR